MEEGGWVQVRKRDFDGRSDGIGDGAAGEVKRRGRGDGFGRRRGMEAEVVPFSSNAPSFFPLPFPFPSRVALTEGSTTGVTAVTSLAFFKSFPPEKPVTRRVVPTDKRKTSVYFLDGSRFERRVKGLLLLLGGGGGEVADVAAEGESEVESGGREVAIACETKQGRSGRKDAKRTWPNFGVNSMRHSLTPI